MKTSINIPDDDLREAIKLTGARTKRAAVVTALRDFNQRKRMAALIKHAGTCRALVTAGELQKQRRRG